ncbi:YggS family pyridoxal phosphate-dependent enzyme [Arthrobacter sp. I2-34]|uniref:Pyridoxal phosphate homeostasis protein n=1 Tax=Arthrobacter hankyongi TaxID=2904801 RepID=A0ABS9LAY8_9MICC|nr:YggS family pyridoxal phosphate-dependent enzyme [Arthrobacter hankyongi]MCG2623858.1 YggS family pyridoxal phosphate-dependent enzyme [Arthrobacter hankyongi]
MTSRKDELAARLEQVRGRIDRAAAGRPGAAPELIVVTKYFPASDVAALAELGVRDVGENRDQEAAAKAAELAAESAAVGLRWHFIGQLQTNKAKSVVRYAHAVHSVDRPQLVAALSKAVAAEQERRRAAGAPARADLLCLIQVDLDDRPAEARPAGKGRGGAEPEQIGTLAGMIEQAQGLVLGGLMAVAPLGADPAEAFGRLAGFSARLLRSHPDARMLSAGMSQDLEAAVAAGATHLRVGSDVLGDRPALG